MVPEGQLVGYHAAVGSITVPRMHSSLVPSKDMALLVGVKYQS